MNKNPLPKTEFIKSKPLVEAHNRLIESPDFQRGIEISKAHYMRVLNGAAPQIVGDQPNPNAANVSALLFQRLQGVEDFITILYNLAEPYPEPPKAPPQDKLIELPDRGRPRN